MSDSEVLDEILEKAHQISSERLQEARAEARARGKEPFDLARLHALWRWCPDAGEGTAAAAGEWEWTYYVVCPDILTMEAFAFRMRVLTDGGALSG